MLHGMQTVNDCECVYLIPRVRCTYFIVSISLCACVSDDMCGRQEEVYELKIFYHASI